MRGLALSGLAGLAVSACRPVRETGTVDRRLRGQGLILGFPDLAGLVAEVNGNGLILAGPADRRAIAVDEETMQLDLQGEPVKQRPARLGETLLVWLNPSRPDAAVALRPLPPIRALPDPVAQIDGQWAGTGETRPFGPLSLITRAGWGAAGRRWVSDGESGVYDPAANPNGWLVYDEPLADRLHTLIVHHSALEFHEGPLEVQALHMTAAKFADIGYHFLIDGLGKVYEGRPLNVRGAHTGGFNTGYVGVCLLGNFEIAPPVQAQLDALALLAAYLKEELGIIYLGGHRDFQPGVTVCPGQNLHPQLPPLAEALNLNLSGS